MSWEREEGWGGLGDGLRAGLVDRLHTVHVLGEEK